MRSNILKSLLSKSGFAASLLLVTGGAAFGQQTINLTAGPANAALPNGSVVPMWGYSCGAPATGTTATCAALNTAAGTNWSPIVITVPTGQALTINLTNNLVFGANSVPTSLVIVGQLGGGLGDVTQRTTSAAPDHSNAQSVTWPIAGTTPGTAPPVGAGTPPVQSARVQSFSTEVAAGATTPLTWSAANLRPGTYLIESGTHPSIQGPMGLYGILVVTTAPAGSTPGTAYPAVSTTRAVSTAAVTYNADVPLLMSEIDPVQNASVDAAVNTAGFNETRVWSGLPGGCGNRSLRRRLPDLLSASGELLAAVLPVQWRGIQQDQRIGLAVPCEPEHGRQRKCPGALRECRPAHARAVDRRRKHRSGPGPRTLVDRRRRQSVARAIRACKAKYFWRPARLSM